MVKLQLARSDDEFVVSSGTVQVEAVMQGDHLIVVSARFVELDTKVTPGTGISRFVKYNAWTRICYELDWDTNREAVEDIMACACSGGWCWLDREVVFICRRQTTI